VKSKNATSLHIVKSTYDRKTGKSSNKVVRKPGTMAELSKVHEDSEKLGARYCQKND